ncbi:serine hydrolase domain-containing protein [Telluribacter humicola]|uniref:serine hydrolase domain-containing protein n=1 Tax=Telluribacter humicola TaxID=1720261 RepID=UPI001A9737A4|nr:serine hydrolase domain-containing protein [Telluribacter humicola]
MKKLLLVWTCTCLSTLALAQSKSTQFDSLFTHLHRQGNFNGNVLIAENGLPIFEKSYGMADEQSHRLLNPESVFELASISKQFTAMAIVLLQKQSKLAYDDPMAKYLPELASYDKITIRHLLHHTSGLPDYTDYFIANWDKSRFATNKDVINAFGKVQPPLLFQPNGKFKYSNTNYVLLGSIIERVSGQTYADFLNQAIFKPLGMNRTQVYQSRYKPQKIENYALGYMLDSLGHKVLLDSYGKEFFTYFLDGIVGDRMVNASSRDLLIWDQALYTDKLVSTQDREQLFNSIKTQDGRNTDYGFGWILKQDEKYGKLVSHSGSWAGYIHYFDRHIDTNKTIIVLQNIDTFKNRINIEQVRKVLYP